MRKNQNKFLIGAVVGSTLAALATLLFSTEQGRKIKRKLVKRFQGMAKHHHGFGLESLTKLARRKLSSARPKKIIRKIRRVLRSKFQKAA